MSPDALPELDVSWGRSHTAPMERPIAVCTGNPEANPLGREVHRPFEAGVQLRGMVLDRITRDPAVMGGKPCVRGMRVTVGMIVGLVASGHTTAEILTAYPYIEEGDVRQALAYAAWRVEEFEVPLPTA